MKAVCVWLELKPLYYNGQIENARQKAREIAAYLEISRRTYFKQVKKLRTLGLISFNDQGTMFLKSWKMLYNLYGIDRPGRFRYYRLKNEFVRCAEYYLRLFAIKENFKIQEHTIEHKVFESQVKYERQVPILKGLAQVQKANIPRKDKERICEDLTRQIEVIGRDDLSKEHRLKSKYKRNGLLAALYRQAERHYYGDLHRFDAVHTVNFDVSMSCERMAQLYNLQSKSGGHYWQKKLAAAGLMEIEKRAVLVDAETGNISKLVWAIQQDVLQLHHFSGTKGIWKRLNNRFHFANLSYI